MGKFYNPFLSVSEGTDEHLILQYYRHSFPRSRTYSIFVANSSVQALDTIKQSETNEVKILAKPPMGVKIVCEAVCVMLGIKPVRIPDPEDPSKRIMDFWGPSQKMLGEADFIAQLKG